MRALLLVDLQYDFMPGGALAVPEGDAVVPLANRLMDKFDLVTASQDWHPADHGSFASRHPGAKPGDRIELDGLPQTLWPDHCVQGTRGAELHDDLRIGEIDRIFRKGQDRLVDSYSAFYDNARRRSTGLGEALREQEVDELYVMGLATDYCVLYSVLDAAELGFKTVVVADGCRGIDLTPGDVEAAWEKMRIAGRVIRSKEILG
ncbi:MAG: bifunctional nicotinamidase/pyrazinamidase [Acidobacteria bacterium]|nr:bifunctional nicotinamidase/pyrazinamidase [Acidobacteriota bacterium]